MTSKYANRTEKNLSPVTFKNLVFDGTAPNPQPQRKSEFYELPPIYVGETPKYVGEPN